MVDVVNLIFYYVVKKDFFYVWFGEDIEDFKGGVFWLIVGMFDSYFDCVFNLLFVEVMIIGVVCGMVCYGKWFVFEL